MKEMYGCSEFSWQTLRIAIYGGLCYAATLIPKIVDLETGPKVVIGIAIGTAIYITIFIWFLNQMMFILADCEGLTPYDSLLLQDDTKCISNIVGTLFFEKFEFEEMRDYLMERTSLLHKCRSKLVKKFGIWWFQRMSLEEWNSKKADVFTKVEGIHTAEQLNKYMCELETTRDPFDNVQFHYYLLSDWSENESAIILKTHHVFTDGLGYATLFLAMQTKEYDPN